MRRRHPGFHPEGVEHTWQNVGDEPARLLIVTAPAGFERFFELFAQIPADASRQTSSPIGERSGCRSSGRPWPSRIRSSRALLEAEALRVVRERPPARDRLVAGRRVEAERLRGFVAGLEPHPSCSRARAPRPRGARGSRARGPCRGGRGGRTCAGARRSSRRGGRPRRSAIASPSSKATRNVPSGGWKYSGLGIAPEPGLPWCRSVSSACCASAIPWVSGVPKGSARISNPTRRGYTEARTNIRGRPGLDVVGSPAELQVEVPGRPRKTTGKPT